MQPESGDSSARISTDEWGGKCDVCAATGRGIVQTDSSRKTSKLMRCECVSSMKTKKMGGRNGNDMHTLDDSVGRARGCGLSRHFVPRIASLVTFVNHRRGARDDSARPCISSGFHATRCIASAKSTHSRRLSLLSNQSESRLATSSS
jgi:hypothetical protein